MHSGLSSKPQKVYKPIWKEYLIMITISIVLMVLPWKIQVKDSVQTCIGGISTGIFASTIVAILIDCTNCRQKNICNHNLESIVLNKLDTRVNAYLQYIIINCIRHSNSIEIKQLYSIDEISQYLSLFANNPLPICYELNKGFEEGINEIDLSVFCISDNSQSISIYDTLSYCRYILKTDNQLNSTNTKVEREINAQTTLELVINQLSLLYHARGIDVIVFLSEPLISDLFHSRSSDE